MRLVEGVFRPDNDMQGVNCALEQFRDLDEAIGLCADTRIAVQAGGNCGVFPRYLATKFTAVYTFEPENENFACLVNNAPATNIMKLQAAVGDKFTSPMGLMYHEKNSGGHFVTHKGMIPVIAVDNLCLSACDLLQLDIEGYELFALRGAQSTIIRHSPVIMIEHKKHAERYGAKPDDVLDYLKSLGYIERKRVRRDIIFTKGENHA